MTIAPTVDETMLASPQPIGILPMPAGLLLVPAVAGADQVCAGLAAGRVPEHWPSGLEGHACACAGDTVGAIAAFSGADPVSAWNRWVLDPEGESPEAVREGLPADLRPLVDVVRFVTGQSDQVCDVPSTAPVGARALAASARAASALEQGDAVAAVQLLDAAADDVLTELPALAALLRANAGAAAYEHGLDLERARLDLTAAVEALAETDLDVPRAEAHHQLGAMAHEQAAARGEPLRLAMHHYHTVLQLVNELSAPYLWATTQLGLAAAYLASPMTGASDQLRHAVATQALRSSLRVLTAEEHPAQWATATLNLANALVYTPSTHQGDNLVEAVELYETVLERRPRATDPLGRARVLANQGNVLAHLGMFEPAKAKLVEARFLFEEQLDHDGVLTVRSVLDEIARAGAGSDDESDAREMAQMARMPVHTPVAAPIVEAAPKPKVTILNREAP